MNKLLVLWLTMLCGIAIATGAAAAEEKLVIYTARDKKLNNIIINGFEKKYNIKVERISGRPYELLKRVRTEAESGHVYADIHWAEDETVLFDDADLFQPYLSKENKSMMPNFRNNGRSVFNRTFGESNVIFINTKLLSELGVTVESYADLLNPKLAEQIVMGTLDSSQGTYQSLAGILCGTGLNSDPLTDPAWHFMDKLIANMAQTQVHSQSQVYRSVAVGEYAVGLSLEGPCIELEKSGAYPVKVVYPKEGTIILPQSVQIVKGARNLANAKLFVDYMLSKECQSNVAQAMNLRPLRAGVQVNANMPPTEKIKLIGNCSIDYLAVNKPLILCTLLHHMD